MDVFTLTPCGDKVKLTHGRLPNDTETAEGTWQAHHVITLERPRIYERHRDAIIIIFFYLALRQPIF